MQKASLAFVTLLAILSLREEGAENRSCVRHIESLSYPRIPQTAQISGDVVVKVAINREGKVENAEVISGPRALADYAVANARRWTFEGRADAPRSQTITYEFEIGKANYFEADLPDRVKIGVEPLEPEPERSTR